MEEFNQGNISFSVLKDAWLRKKWWLTGFLLLILCAGTAVVLALPDLYRSSTKMLMGQNAITESLVTSGVSIPLDQRLYLVEQELLSRDRLLQLIEQYGLYENLQTTVPEALVINRMRRDIAVSRRLTSDSPAQRDRQGPIEVVVSYQGWDPDEVSAITNTLGEHYRTIYESMRFNQASRTTAFLREQLDEIEALMQRQEQQIREFRLENLGRLPQQMGVNVAALDRLNQDLRLNGQRQMQLLERQFENSARTTDTSLLTTMSDETRLSLLRRERLLMGTRLNERHPDMIRLQERIDQLGSAEPSASIPPRPGVQDMIPVMAIDDLPGLLEEDRNLRAAIARLQQQIEQMPAVEQELSKLEHDYAVTREQRLALLRRYEDARLSESMEQQQSQESQILEFARPAVASSAPARDRLLIMVVVAGLALTAMATYLYALSYKAFGRVTDLRQYTSLPVLASIAQVRTTGERLRSGMYFSLAVVSFVMILVVLSTATYQKGQNAHGIVWTVAGDNQ